MQDLSGIQKVILYIEEHYTQDIDKKVIEQISHYSYDEIESVFEKIFKENIPSFQKRINSEKTLQKTEIRPESMLETSQELAPAKSLFIPKKIVFFKGIITDYNNDEIAQLWDTMDVPVKNTKEAYYGLIVDQQFINTNTKCRFEAAVYAPNAEANLENKTIFGRKYLQYTYKGSYDNLDDYYRLMYQDFLFQRNIQLDNSPIIEHYEMNDMNCSDENEFITHVYVPIK